MSNGQGLPPALASRQRRSIIDDAVSGLGMARGAHVSIAGNRFTLVNEAGAQFMVPTLHLDVIVIDANANTSKVFYEGEYDPSNPSAVPPTCYSDNGTGPSINAMQPQAPTCAVCQWNVIGSDVSRVSGKGIKACSDRKKLAVIIPDDPAVNVYELQVPPGSLTNLRAYSKWIAQQASGDAARKLDIADLVTRIEFEPGKMGVLKFTPSAFADDERTLQLIQYIDDNKLSDGAVGRNDRAHDPETVKQIQAGQRPQLAAPTAAPAQQFALPPRAAPAPAQIPQFQMPGGASPPSPVQAVAPVPPAAQPSQQPAPAASSPPAGSRRRRAAAPPQPAPQPVPAQVAPFMQPAGQPPAPAAPAPRAADGLDIPPFLQRGQAPAPQQATPQFGMAAAPPPPANLQAALGNAMSLPTRR